MSCGGWASGNLPCKQAKHMTAMVPHTGTFPPADLAPKGLSTHESEPNRNPLLG